MSGIGQREVLFSLGESVIETDLNNMQRFLRAFTCDWMLGSAGCFQGSFDAGASRLRRDRFVLSLGDSGAPNPTGVARQITNLAGPMCWWNPGPSFPLTIQTTVPANWGVDPYLMVYWLTEDELKTTHAVGDATNPRWDLVCVRMNEVINDVADEELRSQKQVDPGPPPTFVISTDLFPKRRKVTIDKVVVAGTPAASPAIPGVPAGYRPFYAVLVPATFNAAFPVDDNLHDYRLPMGGFSVDVSPIEAVESGSGGPTALLAGSLRPCNIPNGATMDFVPKFTTPQSCRLIGTSILSGLSVAGGASCNYGRFNSAAGGTFNLQGGNSTWALSANGSGVSGQYIWRTFPLGEIPFFGNQAGNFPPTASWKPVWGTGWPSGYASSPERSVAVNTSDFLGLRMDCTGLLAQQQIARVRFHFAGMPY